MQSIALKLKGKENNDIGFFIYDSIYIFVYGYAYIGLFRLIEHACNIFIW